VNDDGREASPEWRAVMRLFWRRIMIIQTIVIVALVKLLPDI
jgi:hypothetical protein